MNGERRYAEPGDGHAADFLQIIGKPGRRRSESGAFPQNGDGAQNIFYTVRIERHAALDLVLELNGEWQEGEEVGALIDPHSGGNLLFLSPGIRYVSELGWNTALSVGIPVTDRVYRALESDQNEREYRQYRYDRYVDERRRDDRRVHRRDRK